MWLCLSDSFLSIVGSDQDDAVLMVRARRPGDIEAVFGDTYPVTTIAGRDYMHRAFIPREVCGEVIGKALAAISYTNFKGSVSNDRLHDAYMDVWHVMARLQPCKPYSDMKPCRVEAE